MTASERAIYALLTEQGTAAAETALCELHLENEDTRFQAIAAADVDTLVDKGFIDCTGNEALRCIICGAFPNDSGICQNCSEQAALYLTADDLRVCSKCLAANEGRTGWGPVVAGSGHDSIVVGQPYGGWVAGSRTAMPGRIRDGQKHRSGLHLHRRKRGSRLR